MSIALRITGLSVLTTFGFFAPALAQAAPGYVGTWAVSRAACANPADKANAPLVITADRLDQFETHCNLTKMRRRFLGGWEATARCQVEGSIQYDTLSLKVRGPTLVARWGKSQKSLTRVKC